MFNSKMAAEDLRYRQQDVIRQMKNIEAMWTNQDPTEASKKTHARLVHLNYCIENVLLSVYGANE